MSLLRMSPDDFERMMADLERPAEIVPELLALGEKVHRKNCRTGRGRAPMQNRVIRVPDDVWEAAQRTADANDEYLSEAIRRMLERYGKDYREKGK